MKLLLMLKGFKSWAACFFKRREGFGLYEILGIAAVIIVAAAVIIPGFKNFADAIMRDMSKWWSETVSGSLFPSSLEK